MKAYAPDGAYPEGPMYWEYGTTSNVLLLAVLEHALGGDFGLARHPGFLATPGYFLHAFGPGGLPFNYSDCGTGAADPSPGTLEQPPQRLTLTLGGMAAASWCEYPTDPPPAAHDAPNPGTRMVGFEVWLAAGESKRWTVRLRLAPP
jgi:hypothetical protein